MIKTNVLICGLPSSGKTTFLAALWHLIFHKEIDSGLFFRSLPENREYLNQISDKWRRFIEIAHTPTSEFQEITLKLKDEKDEIDLLMPDMSGESWKAIWTTRLCTEELSKWIKDDANIMLFLHADNIIPPIEIMDLNAMAAEGDFSSEKEFKQWSPDNSPTQVILVDILQTLSMPPIGKRNRKLAVLVSAWDIAEDMGKSPVEYLEIHFPLLYQYLKYSNDFSEFKVYGVSAQGGDLKSPTDTKVLKAENIPSKRIRVVADDCIGHDLTLPIKWLMVQ